MAVPAPAFVLPLRLCPANMVIVLTSGGLRAQGARLVVVDQVEPLGYSDPGADPVYGLGQVVDATRTSLTRYLP